MHLGKNATALSLSAGLRARLAPRCECLDRPIEASPLVSPRFVYVPRQDCRVDAQEADWQQQDLFGGAGDVRAPEPILMALHAEYYDLIWQGLKTHEFRRRFLEGRPTRWFVYLNAPVSRLGAVIDLGPAVVDKPEAIAAIAERARPGNGASVLEYVQDLERAFAIPILRVREYPGLSIDELRAELGRFHPPQGYIRLNQHPELLRVGEKLVAGDPARQMSVHHQ